ncbi:MAG TPA: GH25 family lysozyme [Kofleriaceae bacterium]|nr:GH25 family lysozyme [Kofleriaceae bacterium]
MRSSSNQAMNRLMRRAILPLGVSALAASACTLAELPPESEREAEAEVEQTMSVCADGPTIYGIDVSRYQGAIEWPKVAASGVVYAYIQISRSLTDLDPRFEENWRNAKQAGVLRGAYQRFHPGQDVDAQADIFLQKLGPFEAGDLPPMLDVEDADGLPAQTIAARVRQWLDRVEPIVRVRPLIYTGFYFWRDSVGGADLREHPLWIANYSATCPLVPAPWTRWAFHQYSATATIPGITANTVDVDKFNGTLEQLKALGRQACEPGRCGDAADVIAPGAGALVPGALALGEPDASADAADDRGAGCAAGSGAAGGTAAALALGAWAGLLARRRTPRRGARAVR